MLPNWPASATNLSVEQQEETGSQMSAKVSAQDLQILTNSFVRLGIVAIDILFENDPTETQTVNVCWFKKYCTFAMDEQD